MEISIRFILKMTKQSRRDQTVLRWLKAAGSEVVSKLNHSAVLSHGAGLLLLPTQLCFSCFPQSAVYLSRTLSCNTQASLQD